MVTDFEVKIIKNYGSDGKKLVGCDVVVYDQDDKLETITIMNAEQAQALADKIESLDSSYVTMSQLQEFCENIKQTNTINASKLNGLSSDKYSKDGHTHTGYLNSSHADIKASTTSYGHVQIVDNLTSTDVTGKALSAKQGKILNDKLTEIINNYNKNSLRIKIGRWSDDKGEDGTQIQVDYGSGNGIYAKLYCDDTSFSIKDQTIIIVVNGVAYKRVTDSTGKSEKVTINLAKNTDSTPYMVSAFCRGNDNMNPASEQKLLYVV